jgi:hypothetical protein
MKFLKMLGLAAVAAAALMAFVGAGTASATTLEVGGAAQNKSVAISASLQAGTSALLKDEFGTTTDTCTTSTVAGSTTTFTPTVSGPISTLTFGSCSHTTTVIAKGNLSVAWIPTTEAEKKEGKTSTNGTVSSNGAEVTVQSTFFGASAVCKTGAGTTLGPLTGATTAGNPGAHATIDINAKINCGILGSSSWTGTYTVTSPTDLGVVS